MGLIVATANFYLTDAGKAAALDATNASIDIEITQIALGTAKYNAQVTAPTQTALTTEMGRYNLAGGGLNGQVLRLTTTITPNYTADIFEIGLFLSDGTLFAVAAVTGTNPLMQTANGLTSVITIGVSLADIGSNVTVSVDANSPIAVVLMNQHIEHSDPHPQYVLRNEVVGNNNSLSEKFFPYYSCIITSDINYNPAIALESLLGANTKWRKLPFLLNGVNNSGDVGKLTYLKSGADVVAMNVIIWQRMPNDYVTPVAQIYYASSGAPNVIDADEFFAFDHVNHRSFYIIKMNVAVDLPIQYKMTSSGKVVDHIIKESSGFLFVDDDGFGLIPTRVKKNANAPLDFDHKIELSLSEQYQHVCMGGDQKYRFLDTKNNLDTNAQNSMFFSKKYVSANEQFEIIVPRLATNVEDQFLVLSHIYLNDVENLGITSNYLRAVDYFDLMPESFVGVTLHGINDGGYIIADSIFKLSFAENEFEKKIVLRVKKRQILNRMNILAQLNDDNNLSGLSLDDSNNFVLEKNIPQPSYLLSYNILGLTLTISLDTTLVPENTHVAWDITNYEGDPISPNDMSGEFVIGADGHAEVVFTIPNTDDAFSFSFNLTGRKEYVGVKRE